MNSLRKTILLSLYNKRTLVKRISIIALNILIFIGVTERSYAAPPFNPDGNTCFLTHLDNLDGNNQPIDEMGHTIVLNNGSETTPQLVMGRFADGMIFNGSRYFIGSLSTGISASSNTSFTIETWCMLAPENIGGYYPIKIGSSTDYIAIYVNVSTRYSSLLIAKSGQSNQYVTGDIHLLANQWNHIAATFENGIIKLYVNGVSAGTGTYTGAALQLATGSSVIVGGPGWRGVIDEVRISNNVRYGAAFTPPFFVTVDSPYLRQAKITHVSSPPVFDAGMTDAKWQQAVPITGFRYADTVGYANPVFSNLDSTVYMVEDGTAIYVAAKMNETDCSGICAIATMRDGAVTSDDCFELVIAPLSPLAGCTANGYFHFAVNSIGTVYDDQGGDPQWSCTGLEAQSFVNSASNNWISYLKIPFSSLGVLEAPLSGTAWSFNVCRQRYAGGSQQITAYGEGRGALSKNNVALIYSATSGTASCRADLQNRWNTYDPQITALYNNISSIIDQTNPPSNLQTLIANWNIVYGRSLKIDDAINDNTYEPPEVEYTNILTELDSILDSLTILSSQIQAVNVLNTDGIDYLVFLVHPFDQIADTTIPDLSLMDRPIEIDATPGQYVNASCLVYAGKNLTNVDVSIDNLQAATNIIIPSSAIDLRIVNVWSGPDGRKAGELLLKDDRVDLSSGYPYLVQTGNPQTDIPENSSKKLWLTIKIPQDALPGLYQGNLHITPSGTNTPSTYDLPVKINVWPFKLDKTDRIYNTYLCIGRELDILQNYMGSYNMTLDQAFNVVQQEFNDMLAHGMNSIDVDYMCDQTQQYRVLQMYHDSNVDGSTFTGPLVWWIQIPLGLDLLTPPPEGGPNGTNTVALKNEITTRVNYAINTIGIPQSKIILYSRDEPHNATDEMLLQEEQNFADSIGLKTVSSVIDAATLNGTNPDCILAGKLNIVRPNISYENAGTQFFTNLQYGNRSGFDSVGCYWQSWNGVHRPTLNRMNSGLNVWKTNVDGATPFQYHFVSTPLANEFDYNYRWTDSRMMTTWLSPSGPVPTIAWEAVRAGIYDVRYLTTVTNLINKRSSDVAYATVAAQAQQTIDNMMDSFSVVNDKYWDSDRYINITSQDYDDFCKTLAGYIVDLRSSCLYVGEYTGKIHKYSRTGVDLGTFISTPYPSGIAIDKLGNIYVSSDVGNSIKKFSPDGIYIEDLPAAGLSSPYGMAFDSSGNLYVVNYTSKTIRKFSPSGTDMGDFVSTGLAGPTDIAFDKDGNLFVADYLSDRIHKYSADGSDLGVFGPNVGRPCNIAIDCANNVYATSNTNHNIRKISPTGSDLGVFAGNTPYPRGLTFDNNGNLYVAEYLDRNIGKYSSTGNNLGSYVSTGDHPHIIKFDPLP